jgi:DNA repair protein RecN (Recombination protein N)
MDIHSQHETLQLGNHIFQLHLVDAFAENQSLKESYGEAWQLYVKAKKSYEDLVSQAESLRQEADYVRFQLDELMKAELQEQEQESLESELKVMEHAEEIKNRFQSILQALSESDYASLHSVREAVANLQHISGFSPLYEVLHKRLDSVLIELSDIVDEISKAETDIEFDPERTEFVKERLSLLYRLMKKHRMNTVGELITLQESLQQKDAITSNVDEALAQAKSMFTAAETRVSTAAKSLSESRKKVFQPLCLQLTKLLKDLGIPDATMVIENQPTEPSAYGIDRLEILFSANKGIAPRPLAQVASGGEFSRVMFSIKYIMTEKTAMPTLILDEIDSGVSGEVAMMLGNMMKRMSKKHQIISITHLPQIAAKGNAHYFVFKDNSSNKTISSVKQLQDHERVEEIAKMIGGAKPSKIALENAQELLAQ